MAVITDIEVDLQFDIMMKANHEFFSEWLMNPVATSTIPNLMSKYEVIFPYCECPFPLAIPKDFVQISMDYLDQHQNDPALVDSYFNRYTPLWGMFMGLGMYSNAEELWRIALKIASSLEAKGGRLHKGTPYYFHAVTSIMGGEMDKGFVMMHHAVEEDKTTYGAAFANNAAYGFVTLDFSNQQQFFYEEVKDLRKYLEAALNEYPKMGYAALPLSEFKRKFLESKGVMQDVVFSFVYTLSRMKYQVNNYMPQLENTDFSSLLELQIISDLCLIVDSSMAQLHHLCKPMFAKRLEELTGVLADPSNFKFDVGTDSRTGHIMARMIADPDLTLEQLMKGNFFFKDGSKPTQIETDMAITYGLRNLTSHNIEHRAFIHSNYMDICQRILNSLFFIVSRVP